MVTSQTFTNSFFVIVASTLIFSPSSVFQQVKSIFERISSFCFHHQRNGQSYLVMIDHQLNENFFLIDSHQCGAKTKYIKLNHNEKMKNRCLAKKKDPLSASLNNLKQVRYRKIGYILCMCIPEFFEINLH